MAGTGQFVKTKRLRQWWLGGVGNLSRFNLIFNIKFVVDGKETGIRGSDKNYSTTLPRLAKNTPIEWAAFMLDIGVYTSRCCGIKKALFVSLFLYNKRLPSLSPFGHNNRMEAAPQSCATDPHSPTISCFFSFDFCFLHSLLFLLQLNLDVPGSLHTNPLEIFLLFFLPVSM